MTFVRGGLVFKAHRLLYHSTLGMRVIQKKKRTCVRLRRYLHCLTGLQGYLAHKEVSLSLLLSQTRERERERKRERERERDGGGAFDDCLRALQRSKAVEVPL